MYFINRVKQLNLTQQYFLFVVIAPLTLVIATGIVGWLKYSNLKEERVERFWEEAHQLTQAFSIPFNSIEDFLRIVSKRITNGNLDDQSIAEELYNTVYAAQISQNAFSWTVFNFVRPDGRVVATSEKGLLTEEIYVTSDQRSWITEGPENPNTLLISWPDVGFISGKWIIPAAYSIAEESGNFLGHVAMGFDISKLNNQLSSALIDRNSYHYLIVSKKTGKIVISSQNNSKIMDDHIQIKSIINGSNHIYKDAGFLEKPVSINNINYLYYRDINKLPFIILLGENPEAFQKEFNQLVLPYIVQTLALALFVVLLLVFLRKQLINPITKLAHSADAIAHGKLDTKVPHFRTPEAHILAKQLINVQRYIKRVQRIDKKLHIQKNKAERANNIKTEFLANMSHELRTPLNAIIGYAEIIQKEMFGTFRNNRYKDYAADIHRSGTHLLSLINDILDISQTDSSEMTLIEQEINVPILVDSSLKLVQESAYKKRITLTSSVAQNLPRLRADNKRVKQILINLLSNAIKFTQENGAVSLTVKADSNYLSFIVKDNGIGIAKKDLPKILTKFGQVKSAYTRSSDGVGIGLWLVQKLVSAHSAQFDIESQRNKGTTITIRFSKERFV